MSVQKNNLKNKYSFSCCQLVDVSLMVKGFKGSHDLFLTYAMLFFLLLFFFLFLFLFLLFFCALRYRNAF